MAKAQHRPLDNSRLQSQRQSASEEKRKTQHQNLIWHKTTSKNPLSESREAAEQQCRDEIQQQERQWQIDAKKIFDQIIGLQQAIDEQVMPILAKLQDPTGHGSGFFLTPTWLITNAHVTPENTQLDKTRIITMGCQAQNPSLRTDQFGSFARPVADNLPDIAVHNVTSCSASSLPLWLPENEGLDEEIFFCIDPYASDDDQVKYLQKLAHPTDNNHINQRYQCLSDEPPQSGASGTPILKAKLIRSNNENRWCFAIEGLLFGNNEDDALQIHAISIKEELDLIRQDIITLEQEERARQIDNVRRLIQGDQPDTPRPPETHDVYRVARHHSALFDCPKENIKRLWYSHMVAINQSLLIKNNRDPTIQGKMAAAGYADDITKDKNPEKEKNLQPDFDDLLAAIGATTSLRLPSSGRPQTLMKSTYFRLDFEGKKPVFFSIEDNISHNGNPIKSKKGKTYSSVFAKVKILQPEQSIPGSLLMQILKESATRCFDADPNIRRTAVIYYEDRTTIEQSKKKKGKQKKPKTIQMIMKRKKQKRQQESPPSALPKIADSEFLVVVNLDRTGYRIIKPQNSCRARPVSFSR